MDAGGSENALKCAVSQGYSFVDGINSIADVAGDETRGFAGVNGHGKTDTATRAITSVTPNTTTIAAVAIAATRGVTS